MSTTLKMTRQIIWPTIIFLAITTIGAVVGVPLYVYHHGFSWFDFNLFLIFSALTGLSITVGYHRHFSHCNYKTNRFVQFLLLFFGAGAFEMSAYDWSSLHRDHHRYVDTNDDPYSIKKGFWYAHIGWLLFWHHDIDESNVKDLQKNPLVMMQHRHFILWASLAGVILPVAIGALFGHGLAAFLWAVCARLTFVFHSTFFINSACHMIGKATYDIHASAKDSWFVALITNGEGYHNFHHRFPTDYRNGIRRYDWDPSKWLIALMARVGLASNLQRVSNFAIMEAKLAAELETARERLSRLGDHHEPVRLKEMLHIQYDALTLKLAEWEKSARAYRAHLSGEMANRSVELSSAAREKMRLARFEFDLARRRWKEFTRSREWQTA